MAVTIAPILEPDRERVGRFLESELNNRVSAESWARALAVPWQVEQPNAGFMLLDDGEIVGVHLAFYSEREIDGRTERFCNLGAWCVLESHRLHALRLLKALLAQDGYHFTDLSPSGNVIKLNQRLGFQSLDTRTSLVSNLPWPTVPGRGRIITDPAEIERALGPEDLRLYRDHANAGAAFHLALQRDGASCYVVFRRDRRKGLPVFATLLHVSDPQVLQRMWRPLSRHLLLRHGALATLVEHRVAGGRPPGSIELRTPRPKMFKSPSLRPAQIDYFYSELVCVAW